MRIALLEDDRQEAEQFQTRSKRSAADYLIKPVTELGVREVFARLAEKSAKWRPVLTVKTGRNVRAVCRCRAVRRGRYAAVADADARRLLF